MESDLQRYFHVDYRDRWRFDDSGRRRLTLRRLSVLLRHLPPAASTVLATGGSGWTLTDYLLADLFHATAHVPHPSRPKPEKSVSPERAKSVAAFHKRAAERQRQLDAGGIT